MSVYLPGQPVRMPLTYESFANEGYAKSVVAYACINMIAEAVGSLCWLAYRADSKRRDEVPDHPSLKLLRRPNPSQGKKAFLESLFGHFNIAGETFIWANRGNRDQSVVSGEVRELWVLRPDLMEVVPGENGLPKEYRYGVRDQKIVFPVNLLGQSNILHLKRFNPLNPWRGLSPLSAAAMQVDILNAVDKTNLSLTQNSGRPSGAFILQPDENTIGLTDQQTEQFKDYIKQQFSGPENAGRPMVIQYGFDWKQMSLSPVDMDYLNSKKTSKIDVATAFRVPAQMLGIEDSQTYANMEQARLVFWEDNILPTVAGLVEELGHWLMPSFGVADGSIQLEVDKDEIPALAPRRKEKFESVKGAEWMSVNEKREAMQLGPYEESDNAGDKIFVGSGLVPLELAAADLAVQPLTDTEDVTPGDPAADPKAPKKPEPDPAEDVKPEPPKRRRAIRGKALARSRAEWRRQEKLRLTAERKMKAQVKKVFLEERSTMQERLKDIKEPNLAEMVVTRVLEAHAPAWELIYRTNLSDVATAASKHVLELGKSVAGFEEKAAGDRFQSWLSIYLKGIPAKVKKIANVTRKRVMDSIKEDLRAAARDTTLTIDLGKSVANAYVAFVKGRSESISRTETHQAAQEGSRAAARALSLPDLKKEWVSAHDERTRESHAAMDGEKVSLAEKFVVPANQGADEMDGPGDPHGSAENVINCRCATTYSREE